MQASHKETKALEADGKQPDAKAKLSRSAKWFPRVIQAALAEQIVPCMAETEDCTKKLQKVRLQLWLPPYSSHDTGTRLTVLKSGSLSRRRVASL